MQEGSCGIDKCIPSPYVLLGFAAILKMWLKLFLNFLMQPYSLFFFFQALNSLDNMSAGRIVWILCLLASVLMIHGQPKLKRFGQHSAPSKGAMVLGGTFPQPGVFFHHFTSPGKPLLMKNVLSETNFPALDKWTDEYLR